MSFKQSSASGCVEGLRHQYHTARGWRETSKEWSPRPGGLICPLGSLCEHLPRQTLVVIDHEHCGGHGEARASSHSLANRCKARVRVPRNQEASVGTVAGR